VKFYSITFFRKRGGEGGVGSERGEEEREKLNPCRRLVSERVRKGEGREITPPKVEKRNSTPTQHTTNRCGGKEMRGKGRERHGKGHKKKRRRHSLSYHR